MGCFGRTLTQVLWLLYTSAPAIWAEVEVFHKDICGGVLRHMTIVAFFLLVAGWPGKPGWFRWLGWPSDRERALRAFLDFWLALKHFRSFRSSHRKNISLKTILEFLRLKRICWAEEFNKGSHCQSTQHCAIFSVSPNLRQFFDHFPFPGNICEHKNDVLK